MRLAASIILPLLDEAESLGKTIDILLAENGADIAEILIVVCGRTAEEALGAAEAQARRHPALVLVRRQQRPFLGGAMRDAFEWASGTHVIMMASDLETDPSSVKDLIARAREGYDIVTATRWKGRGGFHGYSPLKHSANWLFQKMFGLLYGTPLSDLTYGFRIFRIEWIRKIRWEELRHPFLLETILKPLRLGARVSEIPTTWVARAEGRSHNPFWQNFMYFRIALKTRFRSRKQLLMP
jgi:glycosyltransferase involved in cell wall biosynthesis